MTNLTIGARVMVAKRKNALLEQCAVCKKQCDFSGCMICTTCCFMYHNPDNSRLRQIMQITYKSKHSKQGGRTFPRWQPQPQPVRFIPDELATVTKIRRFPGTTKAWRVMVETDSAEQIKLRIKAPVVRRLLKQAKRIRGNDFDVRLVVDRLHGGLTIGGVEAIDDSWHFLAGLEAA